jgi:hypothetical protein
LILQPEAAVWQMGDAQKMPILIALGVGGKAISASQDFSFSAFTQQRD